MIAHDRLQHLVDEILHGPDHRDHLRRELVGHVNLHLQIDVEDESFLGLGDDLLQLLVGRMRLRACFRPVIGRANRISTDTPKEIPSVCREKSNTAGLQVPTGLADGSRLEFLYSRPVGRAAEIRPVARLSRRWVPRVAGLGRLRLRFNIRLCRRNSTRAAPHGKEPRASRIPACWVGRFLTIGSSVTSARVGWGPFTWPRTRNCSDASR